MPITSQPTRLALDSRAAVVAGLRGEIARRFKQCQPHTEATSTGFGSLDRILPAGGIESGTLVDWLYANPGNGAGRLALRLAAQTLDHESALIVIDPRRTFYPPAAAAMGIDLERLVLVRPPSGKDTLWSWEQSLRSPAVGAVWGLLSRIEPRAFRRLQLAAEASRAVGHMVRGASHRGQPNWAHTQLLVEAGVGARQRITVIGARQGGVGQSVEIDSANTTQVAPKGNQNRVMRNRSA